MDYIMHDSQNSWFRSPLGAVKLNTLVQIKIEANYIDDIYIHVIWSDNSCSEQRMIKTQKTDYPDTYIYTTDINTGNRTGLIFYFFKLIKNGHVFCYGNNADGLGGCGQVYEYAPKSFQITVYKENEIPKWYKEGIVYQIFVDRFYNGNDNNFINNQKRNRFIYGCWDDKPMYIRSVDGSIARWDFYGGNLKGVIKKLDYLKELGVSVIYLNPIFEASSSHKYDTGNYKKIDPMFGDDEIFKELCHKASVRGIHIILDGVFSHTGSDSIYFNKENTYDNEGAYQSKNSPYYGWYQFNEYPDNYKCWWGIKNQPNVNELNPSYLDYIVNDNDSVLNKWMSLGADGWRLDVADELPDEFIKQFKKEMKTNKRDSILIGEVWEDASNKESYGVRREYFLGDELDSTMGYPFRQVIIDFLVRNTNSAMVIRKLNSLKENYPKENFYAQMILLGTHDTERILTTLSNFRGEEEGKELLFQAITVLMTFPGVPHIYYGDEVGLTGGKDPDNRRAFPWGKEDKEILSFYKKVISFRRRSNALKKGSIEFEWVNDDVLKFKREYDNEEVIIIINRSNDKSYDINLNNSKAIMKELLTDNKISKEKSQINVKPLKSYIFYGNTLSF